MMNKFTNLQAEQIIIGTCIMNNGELAKVADILEEKHFYFDEHKAIWRKFVEIATESVANSVTLKNYFETEQSLLRAGGANYLATLLSNTSMLVSVRYYGLILVELWQKREFEQLLLQSLEDLADKKFNLVTAELENNIVGLKVYDKEKKTQHIADIIDEIEKEEEIGLSDKFVSSGFHKLDDFLNGGFHAQQLAILGARPSIGKAQPLNSKILTLNGWKEMGQIQVGDKLASVDGQESEVLGVFHQGKREIFKVFFQDGRVVECCKEHLWRIYYRDWEKPRIICTERLIQMLGRVRYKRRLWIDEFLGDFGSDENLLVDPWVLGVLIGDGCLTSSVTFSNSSLEIIEKLQARLGSKFIVKKRAASSTIDYNIRQAGSQSKKGICGVRPNELKEKLKQLKLFGCKSYEKFIPAQYLRASKETRIELLRGLLDTDGYVSIDGNLEYSTSSEQLAKDVVYLAQSLGATTYLRTKKSFFTYKGLKKEGRLHYRISINCSKQFDFVSYSKKQQRLKEIKYRQKRNTLLKIESAGYKEAQCIKVSHASSLYITDNFIPTHNTSVAQQIILNASQAQKKCLFFSLEVDKKNVFMKFMANLKSILFWKILKKAMNQSEMLAYSEGKKELRNMGIYVNDSSFLTVKEINSIVKNQIEKQPIDLIVIDYVQIVKSEEARGKNESTLIKETTSALKALAKQYDVAVLALAQINRKAVDGAKQEPTVNDFKGSGGIEEDADVAIILHRDRSDGEEKSYFSQSGKFIIAKNRHGKTGEIHFNFDGDFGRFTEVNF